MSAVDLAVKWYPEAYPDKWDQAVDKWDMVVVDLVKWDQEADLVDKWGQVVVLVKWDQADKFHQVVQDR